MSVELIIQFVIFIFSCGVVYGEIKSLRKDLSRIEEKVDKHNNFDRRIVALETTVELYHAQERAREMQK